MTGAGFILAINLFMAGLFAASFGIIVLYDKRRKAARWFSLSYAIGMSTILFEFALATLGASTFLSLAAFGSFLLALAIFNVGVARNYSVPAPWLAMMILVPLSLVVCALTLEMPRQSFVRMLAYQSPYFVLQVMAVGLVAQARTRKPLDILLMVLLALSALQFLSKPFLFSAFGGAGATPDLYITTSYAMFSQSMGTVFAMAIALMLLIILVRDVLFDADERSQTDSLSGLFNRGGFEVHAEKMLNDADKHGTPVSLVIADLDHFKSINDNFGHSAGDTVIVSFSAFLRSTIEPHYLAGRVGGEEFAVLLTGANVVSARLFAENARSAFGSLSIEGLPPVRRVTASFGVAERGSGESIRDLLGRADEALYLAKRSGRDCVKIAPRPGRRWNDEQGAAVSLG
jgi:diguanylate cyclase (GGDEF)-like protein